MNTEKILLNEWFCPHYCENCTPLTWLCMVDINRTHEVNSSRLSWNYILFAIHTSKSTGIREFYSFHISDLILLQDTDENKACSQCAWSTFYPMPKSIFFGLRNLLNGYATALLTMRYKPMTFWWQTKRPNLQSHRWSQNSMARCLLAD